jgi:uncharacterized membrane protein
LNAFNTLNPYPVWTRGDVLFVAAMVFAGLALRLPGLDAGLWFDEIIFLVNTARLPVEEIVTTFRTFNNHVLYSLSAHAAMSLFGESAWSLRLPALVFGIASIPPLYILGRQVANRQEAVLATVFLVASYHHVWFSQDARGYTGLVLGALITTILFIRLVSELSPPRLTVFAYAVCAALLAWIHLTGVLVICAHGVIGLLLAARANRESIRSLITGPGLALFLAGIFILILYAPILSFVAAELATTTLPPDSPRREAIYTLREFSLGLQRALPGGWLAIVAVVSVLAAGAVSYARQSIAALAFVLLPVAITLLFIIAVSNVLYPRFLFSTLPFILLIGVRGGFALAARLLPYLSRRQVYLIGLAVALASAAMVPAAWKPKQDFVAAANFIAQNRKPDDALICVGLSYFPMARYLGVDCAEVRELSDLDRGEQQSERAWLVYTLPDSTSEHRPELWRRILSEYSHVKTFPGTVGKGDVVIMSK